MPDTSETSEKFSLDSDKPDISGVSDLVSLL